MNVPDLQAVSQRLQELTDQESSRESSIPESPHFTKWERFQQTEYLRKSLHKHFGQKAERKYMSDAATKEEPRLIDDLRSREAKLYEEQKSRRHDQRRHLVSSHDNITQHRKEINRHIQAPFKSLQRPITIEELNRAKLHETQQPIEDDETVIQRLQNNLPTQITKHKHDRGKYWRLFDNTAPSYRGEHGPQSYQPHQMQHYYMVKELVEDFVDEVLDTLFRHLPVAVYNSKPLLTDEVQEQWIVRRRALATQNAVQLIAEELLLTVGSEISLGIAQEFMVLVDFIKSRTDNMFMKTTEQVALGGTTNPRSTTDPAYTLVTKNYYGKQKERNEHKRSLWVHCVPLQAVPDGQPDLPQDTASPAPELPPDLPVLSDEG